MASSQNKPEATPEVSQDVRYYTIHRPSYCGREVRVVRMPVQSGIWPSVELHYPRSSCLSNPECQCHEYDPYRNREFVNPLEPYFVRSEDGVLQYPTYSDIPEAPRSNRERSNHS
uniref:AlaS_4 protein n=1 Tax=Fopius arisanus TaxID=64838 RepID=A0A0C9R1N0_9HYME